MPANDHRRAAADINNNTGVTTTEDQPTYGHAAQFQNNGVLSSLPGPSTGPGTATHASRATRATDATTVPSSIQLENYQRPQQQPRRPPRPRPTTSTSSSVPSFTNATPMTATPWGYNNPGMMCRPVTTHRESTLRGLNNNNKRLPTTLPKFVPPKGAGGWPSTTSSSPSSFSIQPPPPSPTASTRRMLPRFSYTLFNPAPGPSEEDPSLYNPSPQERQQRHAQRQLAWACWVSLAFCGVQVVGGYWAHSLAVWSEALHLFSDTVSLWVSWMAVSLAGRPHHPRYPFGFARAPVIGALLQLLLTWAVAGPLAWSALQRLVLTLWFPTSIASVANNTPAVAMAATSVDPSESNFWTTVVAALFFSAPATTNTPAESPDQQFHNILGQAAVVDGKLMTILAFLGMQVNLLLLVILGTGGGGQQPSSSWHWHAGHSHQCRHGGGGGGGGNLTVRAAYLHTLGDVVQSGGVFVAGCLIWYNPRWTLVDPLVTLVGSAFVFVSSLPLLSESLHILMEGTPSHIDLKALLEGLNRLTHVAYVKDLRVWSLEGGSGGSSCPHHNYHFNNTIGKMTAGGNHPENASAYVIVHVMAAPPTPGVMQQQGMLTGAAAAAADSPPDQGAGNHNGNMIIHNGNRNATLHEIQQYLCDQGYSSTNMTIQVEYPACILYSMRKEDVWNDPYMPNKSNHIVASSSPLPDQQTMQTWQLPRQDQVTVINNPITTQEELYPIGSSSDSSNESSNGSSPRTYLQDLMNTRHFVMETSLASTSTATARGRKVISNEHKASISELEPVWMTDCEAGGSGAEASPVVGDGSTSLMLPSPVATNNLSLKEQQSDLASASAVEPQFSALERIMQVIPFGQHRNKNKKEI